MARGLAALSTVDVARAGPGPSKGLSAAQMKGPARAAAKQELSGLTAQVKVATHRAEQSRQEHRSTPPPPPPP